MKPMAVIVEGMVQEDGTLDLVGRVNLPSGPVHVTIQPVAAAVQPDRFWAMLETIWASQAGAGVAPRSREEIDAEIAASRDESEGEAAEAERLQDECRGGRERPR
ncbi:hypothetical protein OJF2_69530 [Aquisphaera giovannonii]|uniref:Uncharacterized protein n=1 Tax=Aquisphaera giovannonii TaxID=406548 RepID=A0A5B9WCQ1_9BACT|nr:hypothetical protein [Aquisphaera giovannonii]QEH38352.1 hypothetical protein OJF2_69530 [Aquisphaera giovannonii]